MENERKEKTLKEKALASPDCIDLGRGFVYDSGAQSVYEFDRISRGRAAVFTDKGYIDLGPAVSEPGVSLEQAERVAHFRGVNEKLPVRYLLGSGVGMLGGFAAGAVAKMCGCSSEVAARISMGAGMFGYISPLFACGVHQLYNGVREKLTLAGKKWIKGDGAVKTLEARFAE